VAVRVDEEWRVRLTGWSRPARGKPVSAAAVRGLLRSHLGAEVPVSAGKTGIFLYAATADAAATAAGIAQEMLAQQDLFADIALERWDPSCQIWLPPGDVAAAELPSGQEHGPVRRRLRAAGTLIAAIIDASSRGGVLPPAAAAVFNPGPDWRAIERHVMTIRADRRDFRVMRLAAPSPRCRRRHIPVRSSTAKVR
jgi:hypothetical protein